MTFLLEPILFGFLLVMAVAVVRLKNLFAAAMLTGIFSLLSAGLFTLMDAVDVAFTEAAVGAGISTVLILATLSLTGEEEESTPGRRGIAWCVVLATGASLIYATLDMPAYGDVSAPIHHHVVDRYINESPKEIGLPNFVTSILASYRGYDTFGELAVIFTAGIGVSLLLGGKVHRRQGEATRDDVAEQFLNQNPMAPAPPGFGRDESSFGLRDLHELGILRVMAKALVPFIFMFALYVQFHGDFGPGGGFQAGVIFAAGVILYGLIYGSASARKVMPPLVVEIGIAVGLLTYGGVGVYCLLNGENFLNYAALDPHHPAHGQHLGILLVELGVGITVTAVMIAVYYSFTGRKHAEVADDSATALEDTPT